MILRQFAVFYSVNLLCFTPSICCVCFAILRELYGWENQGTGPCGVDEMMEEGIREWAVFTVPGWTEALKNVV